MPHFIRTRLFEKAPFFVLISRSTGSAKTEKASNIKGFRIKDNSVWFEGCSSCTSVLQTIIFQPIIVLIFKNNTTQQHLKIPKSIWFRDFFYSMKYKKGYHFLQIDSWHFCFVVVKCYQAQNECVLKCDEQKPVGWKEPGESCRLVRGKGGVLLEFLLLAVHWMREIFSRMQREFPS